jgi:hypothetical protein
MKSKEYAESLNSKFQDIKVFMHIELFGEKSLTPEDKKRYDILMDKDIDEKNPAISLLDELILKH